MEDVPEPKTTAFSGCNKKCPCPLWVNCIYYTDEYTKNQRLRKKQSSNDIALWYEECFRMDFGMHELYVSG